MSKLFDISAEAPAAQIAGVLPVFEERSVDPLRDGGVIDPAKDFADFTVAQIADPA